MTQETASAVLSIQLVQADGRADPGVDYIELQREGMRHRIAATHPDASLAEVFAQDFAEELQRLLGRLSGPTQVYTDMGLSFDSAALRMKGVQMISTLRSNGETQVIVRFTEVVGDVPRLLRRTMSRTEAESQAIAVEAIEDVVGRTYDVAFVFEHMRDLMPSITPFDGCTRAILSKREELLFRLDLLQRAVLAGAESETLQEPRLTESVVSA